MEENKDSKTDPSPKRPKKESWWGATLSAIGQTGMLTVLIFTGLSAFVQSSTIIVKYLAENRDIKLLYVALTISIVLIISINILKYLEDDDTKKSRLKKRRTHTRTWLEEIHKPSFYGGGEALPIDKLDEVKNDPAINEAPKTARDRERQIFQTHFSRITSEIASLKKRGNLNLLAGVLITAFAALYLAFGGELLVTKRTTSPEVLGHYIPRVTTVVFLEVFAFFFLKTYKSCMAQIEHYHRELTRISANEIAVEMAINTKTEDIQLKIAQSIIRSQPLHSQLGATSSETNSAQETLKAVAEIISKAKA